MFIFLIYSLFFLLGKRFQQQSNMKFAQLHYFLSQNVGGTKDIMSPGPPINSVPDHT